MKKEYILGMLLLCALPIVFFSGALYGRKDSVVLQTQKEESHPSFDTHSKATTTLALFTIDAEKETTKQYTITTETCVGIQGLSAYETLQKEIKEQKKQFIASLEDTDSSISLGQGSGASSEMTLSCRVVPSRFGMSYILHTYIFTGGAHGNASTNTFVFDTEGGRITLDTFFTSKDYMTPLTVKARDYFLKTLQNADKKWIEEGTSPDKELYSHFYVTDKDFIIIFPQYSVAPYVFGEPEAHIPLSDIQEYIAPRFR